METNKTKQEKIVLIIRKSNELGLFYCITRKQAEFSAVTKEQSGKFRRYLDKLKISYHFNGVDPTKTYLGNNWLSTDT